MKLVFHGAGQEVGRSCIEVVEGDTRLLLDAGLKVKHAENEFPTTIQNISQIQHVIVSHIHLDHTGAIPELYAEGLRCPIYTGPLTKDLMPIMLHDSWKVAQIERFPIKYKQEDVDKALAQVITFREDKKGRSEFAIPGAKVTTFPCGHVPGSRSIFLQFKNRNVLYTGDFSLISTRIVDGGKTKDFPKKIDTLIIESTYGNTEHPSRKDVEKDFITIVKKTLASGGHVVLPTFSIGRAQELIMMLVEYELDVPIFLDGMAKAISERFLKHPQDVPSSKKLLEALKSINLVWKGKQRDKVFSQQCIVVTTAGMLDGGPICQYLPKVAHERKTAVLLTGYQAEGSNGRRLLDDGIVEIDGKVINVECFVKKFDFSAHAGMSEIKEIISQTKPKNVVLQHGEMREIGPLKEYVESLNIKCFAPKTGETIIV